MEVVVTIAPRNCSQNKVCMEVMGSCQKFIPQKTDVRNELSNICAQ